MDLRTENCQSDSPTVDFPRVRSLEENSSRRSRALQDVPAATGCRLRQFTSYNHGERLTKAPPDSLARHNEMHARIVADCTIRCQGLRNAGVWTVPIQTWKDLVFHEQCHLRGSEQAYCWLACYKFPKLRQYCVGKLMPWLILVGKDLPISPRL